VRVALFGATGGTGRHVVEQGLALGHQIQALVRDPAKLPDALGPTAVAGDVLDQSAVDRCVEGVDAVICILGTRPGTEPVEDRGTAHIIDAMQRLGPRRLVAVTSLGVGDSAEQIPLLFRVVMNLTMKRIFQAKEAQERLIRDSGLDWTIVRPGGLTDGPRTGSYRSGTGKDIKATRISRADVAEFVLAQLDDPAYLHRTPAVS